MLCSRRLSRRYSADSRFRNLLLRVSLPSHLIMSACVCLASFDQLIDFNSALSWQTQYLLAEVRELRLVAKDSLVLRFIVTLNAIQVILVHTTGLLFAHSFELYSVVLLVCLSLLLIFHLAT